MLFFLQGNIIEFQYFQYFNIISFLILILFRNWIVWIIWCILLVCCKLKIANIWQRSLARLLYITVEVYYAVDLIKLNNTVCRIWHNVHVKIHVFLMCTAALLILTVFFCCNLLWYRQILVLETGRNYFWIELLMKSSSSHFNVFHTALNCPVSCDTFLHINFLISGLSDRRTCCRDFLRQSPEADIWPPQSSSG